MNLKKGLSLPTLIINVFVIIILVTTCVFLYIDNKNIKKNITSSNQLNYKIEKDKIQKAVFVKMLYMANKNIQKVYITPSNGNELIGSVITSGDSKFTIDENNLGINILKEYNSIKARWNIDTEGIVTLYVGDTKID